MGTLNDQARTLRDLHKDLLVLPNAWDAASAAVTAKAGAAAIATSSAGVAWALGAPDGQLLPREEALRAVARIAAAVEIPVTADLENGLGDAAATVTEAIAAGAVGANLEDGVPGTKELLTAADHATLIRRAREAAVAAGVPDFVINARTDVYFKKTGGGPEEVLARAAVYAEAGADCLFVPGLLDLPVLKDLAAAAPLPISVMARPQGPTVAELAATGVRRISLGAFPMLSAYAAAHRAALTLLRDGTYDDFTDYSDSASAVIPTAP